MICISQHKLELIGLEMADEMPFYVGGHLGNFHRKLLRPVLPETSLAGPVGFHQLRHRMKF